MHDDRFDNELKNRLGGYVEEPDDALWKGIAAGISSTDAGLGWLRWLSRVFLASFAVVTVIVGDSRFTGKFLLQDFSGFERREVPIQGNDWTSMNGLDNEQTASAYSADVLSGDGWNGCDGETIESDWNDYMDAVDSLGRLIPSAKTGVLDLPIGWSVQPGEADRLSRDAHARSERAGIDRRRSRAELKRAPIALRSWRLDEGKVVVTPGRSRPDVETDGFQASRSRREERLGTMAIKPSRAAGQASQTNVQPARREEQPGAVVKKGVKEENSRMEVPASGVGRSSALVDRRGADVTTDTSGQQVAVRDKQSGIEGKSDGVAATSPDGVVQKSGTVNDRSNVDVKQDGAVVINAGEVIQRPAVEDNRLVSEGGRDGAVITQAGAMIQQPAVAGEQQKKGERLRDDDRSDNASAEEDDGFGVVAASAQRGGDSAVVVNDACGVFGPPRLARRRAELQPQQGDRRAGETSLGQKSSRATESTLDEKKPANNDVPGRVSMYFTAMPTLGYQRVEANPSDNIVVESFKKVSNFSSKRLGVRAEFGIEYALTARWKAFGGVLYYQRKQTIDYVELVNLGTDYHDQGDTLTVEPHTALEEKSFEYELKNLGIQAGVNYVLWKKKFLHVAGTGVEFHKALNKLSEAQKQLGFSTNPSTYVFYNLYYRVQYPAEGRLKAIFQPTLNYSMYLNSDMNAPFYVKPYGLGLNLGLTYTF